MQFSKDSVQRGKVALIMCTALLNGGCGCNNSGSNASRADYEKIVSTFTVGAVALETGDPDHTLASLTNMTKLAPDEPAGWANLGLYQLRNSQYKQATESLDKASKLQLKPHPGIERLLALLADHNGNLPEAIQHYQKAIELEPDELRTRYSLCEIYSRQATPEAETAYQAEIQAILTKQPYNLVAQIALAKIAAKRGDATAFKQAVGYLDARSATFAPDVLERLKELKAAMASGDMKAAARTIPFLGNLLSQNSGYRMSSNALRQDSLDGIGAPIQQFIVLPKIPQSIAPEDMGITFKSEPVAKLSTGTSKYTNAFWLDEKGAQVLLSGDGRSMRLDTGATLPFPGGAKSTPPTPNGVLAIDTNYDLKNDLIFAGAGGLKLFLQTKNGAFTDATSKSKLPTNILQGAYNGAWSCDIEADGDLDVVLGTASGAPVVLQNNGDDTWNVIHPFTGVSGVQDFAWVDLNGDGSSDAALIDGSGKAHIFMNQRAGIFKERSLPASLGAVSALAVSEMNSDGKLDLLALKPDGAIVRIADSSKVADWEIVEVARWKSPPGDIRPGSVRLIVADLDNNGGLDMIASTPKGAQVWLRGVKELFVPLQTPLSEQIFAALDLDKDGRIDLVGLQGERPVRLMNHGLLNYGWQELLPRAADGDMIAHQTQVKESKSNGKNSQGGDRRTNSFGIGGEVETRAGLLYLKQSISSPVVHVGLGTYKTLDAVRFTWPNGDVRAEFGGSAPNEIKGNSSFSMLHRLKGSCPWVFAWNGKEMGFVTDFIWRSPVGLRINAQVTAGIAQTEDWVKIRGEQLVPHDGFYDVRITAELWETHFFDYIRLMTVDHPANVDIYVDERFSIPPPKLAVHALLPLLPLAKAIDDNGTDVTETVRNLDSNYLDTFGRGEYQGVTRDHFVELDLGTKTPSKGVFYLVASGWIHPTDSSINVAISQGKHAPPQGLSLEVADGKGGWRVAQTGLGFPEGKTKTILLRLDDLFRPGEPKKVRLRTNLEIYWDRLSVGVEAPETKLEMKRIESNSSKLVYRGFSTLKQANLSSPELPDYERLGGRGQRWRDLIGYCTRFGDVSKLLKSVDDRYVIMNAGDEIRLLFPFSAPPPAGWKRDFVLIGDGWEKDGDLNTAYSKTILPLPFHGMKTYNTPPGALGKDPVFKKNPKDWQTYHTRFITPESFRKTLLPGRN